MSMSASTIKFVNQWLKEGAWNLRFTSYEYFDSIEFHTLGERCPYISYPPGTTFLIWFMAKLMGRAHIGISFLKHIQAVFLCIEVLVAALFSQLFLTHLGFARRIEKLIISLGVAITWLYLPGTAWYLSNVLWSDQVVILYIMVFMLLEYADDTLDNGKFNVFARVCKIGIIYIGVLTDYYFWIFVFCAFAMKFLRLILLKMELKRVISEMLEYVCPVVCGVVTFLWQIAHTENWLSILKNKFVYRTVGEVEGSLYEKFCSVYTGGNMMRGGILLIGAAFTSFVIGYLVKKKKIKDIIIRPGVYIIFASILAPVLQILLLRNHSINHECSMVKIGWILAFFPLLYAVFMQYIYKDDINCGINGNSKKSISTVCMRFFF